MTNAELTRALHAALNRIEALEESLMQFGVPVLTKTEVPCPVCGQTEQNQTGEYPCDTCGLPTVHDSE